MSQWRWMSLIVAAAALAGTGDNANAQTVLKYNNWLPPQHNQLGARHASLGCRSREGHERTCEDRIPARLARRAGASTILRLKASPTSLPPFTVTRRAASS
jgi:hypothetical protein